MNSLIDFYNFFNLHSNYKVASLWKRVISSIIDLVFIYPFYIFFVYIIPLPPEFKKYMVVFSFLYCIFFQYLFYKIGGRTVGDFFLKIKPVFITDEKRKDQHYLERAFLKSTIYLPVGFSIISICVAIMMFLGVVILFFNPQIRKNNLLPWDLISGMVVIEYHSIR